jgi:hypothetical protein
MMTRGGPQCLTPWTSLHYSLHLFWKHSSRKVFQNRGSKKKRDRCPGLNSSDQSLRDIFIDVS